MHNFKSVIRTLEQKDESEFWNYITGLRGPDNNNETVKALTTCVIRGNTNGAGGSLAVNQFLYHSHKALTRSMINYHFHTHHGLALLALAYYFNCKKDLLRCDLLKSAYYAWEDNYYDKYVSLIDTFVRMG